MHCADFGIHLQGEVPKVKVKDYGSFCTVEITSEKLTIQYFVSSEQELTNFKNNLLWAFEKPVKM